MWMPCLGLALAAVLLMALICQELGKAVAQASQAYRRRRVLPPAVEMTAPDPSDIRTNAVEAAAKDYTSLLGGDPSALAFRDARLPAIIGSGRLPRHANVAQA